MHMGALLKKQTLWCQSSWSDDPKNNFFSSWGGDAFIQTIDINGYPTVKDRKMCWGDIVSFIVLEGQLYISSIHLRKQTRKKTEPQIMGQRTLLSWLLVAAS